jgi:hypothetical protein
VIRSISPEGAAGTLLDDTNGKGAAGTLFDDGAAGAILGFAPPHPVTRSPMMSAAGAQNLLVSTHLDGTLLSVTVSAPMITKPLPPGTPKRSPTSGPNETELSRHATMRCSSTPSTGDLDSR